MPTMIALGEMSTQAKETASFSFGYGARPKSCVASQYWARRRSTEAKKQHGASPKPAGGVSVRPVVGEIRLAQPKPIAG